MAQNKNTGLKVAAAAVGLLLLFRGSGKAQETKHGAINNPGNIKQEAKIYPGEIDSPNPVFKSFIDLPHGYAAMVIKLWSYFNSGYQTLRQMITHWAPASDNNDPDAYVSYIVDNYSMSADPLDPDAVVPVDDQPTMATIVMLMANFEQGHNFGENTWNDVLKAFDVLNSVS